jgi:hypothetical protein
MSDPEHGLPQGFNEFLLVFIRETDRAAVIVGAAALDQMLADALARVLLPCASAQDELLDSDRPIGSFGPRIMLAHRLGLIDAGIARHLHLIRKLRNAMAHDVAPASLEAAPHRDRVGAIAAPFRQWAEFRRVVAIARQQYQVQMSDPSLEFRTAYCIIAAKLLALANTCGPLDYRAPITLAVPGTREGTEDAVGGSK